MNHRLMRSMKITICHCFTFPIAYFCCILCHVIRANELFHHLQLRYTGYRHISQYSVTQEHSCMSAKQLLTDLHYLSLHLSLTPTAYRHHYSDLFQTMNLSFLISSYLYPSLPLFFPSPCTHTSIYVDTAISIIIAANTFPLNTRAIYTLSSHYG